LIIVVNVFGKISHYTQSLKIDGASSCVSERLQYLYAIVQIRRSLSTCGRRGLYLWIRPALR